MITRMMYARIPPALTFLIKRIKNRRLLIIVWDVANQNLNPHTVYLARQLRTDYRFHNIVPPDLVKAIANYSIEELWCYKPDGSLRALIDDMINEIKDTEGLARPHRIPKSLVFKYDPGCNNPLKL